MRWYSPKYGHTSSRALSARRIFVKRTLRALTGTEQLLQGSLPPTRAPGLATLRTCQVHCRILD